MGHTGAISGFFAGDRRTWARVCGLGLNRAVAYLVLARGTGKSNRQTAWSVQAIETYTAISRVKRKLRSQRSLTTVWCGSSGMARGQNTN
jgi:hypothetical protein